MSTTMSEYKREQREDAAAEAERKRLAAEAAAERKRLDDEAEFDRKLRERRDAAELKRQQQEFAAEQQRLAAEDELMRKQQLAEAEIERKRLASEAKAEARRKASLQKKRDKVLKRAERVKRFKAVAALVRRDGDISLTIAVMACGMVPALVSQFQSIIDMGMGLVLAGLLPFMLEAAAWAATAGESKALAAGRSPWVYRIAVWIFASLAAAVNALHGYTDYADHAMIAAPVLAASSLFPVALWHMVMAGRHAEQRAKAKAARRHDRKRKRDHPEAYRLAGRMVSGGTHGSLDFELAFRRAWLLLEGTDELGMTRDMAALGVQSQIAFAGAVAESAEAIRGRLLSSMRPAPVLGPLTRIGRPSTSKRASKVASESASDGPVSGRTRTKNPQVDSSNPARTRARKDATQGLAGQRGGGRRGRQVDAARQAASDTAKTSSPELKDTARRWVVDELSAGRDVHWKTVAEKFGMGRAWAYQRIGEANDEVSLDRPALHAVGE